MLDLTVQRTKLTQGRPLAVMLFATETTQPSPNSTDAGGTTRTASNLAPQSHDGANAPDAAPVDPRIIADKVYELLRRERAIERQRRGLWH